MTGSEDKAEGEMVDKDVRTELSHTITTNSLGRTAMMRRVRLQDTHTMIPSFTIRDYIKRQKYDGEKSESAYVMVEINFALATQLKVELGQFARESKNCAALNTCCTNFFAGRPWFDM